MLQLPQSLLDKFDDLHISADLQLLSGREKFIYGNLRHLQNVINYHYHTIKNDGVKIEGIAVEKSDGNFKEMSTAFVELLRDTVLSNMTNLDK